MKNNVIDSHSVDLVQEENRVKTLTIFIIGILITVVCLLQNPGNVVSDAKVDIAIAPLKFLKHALLLWDPLQNFGGIPMEAFGYLFPMGPFYIVGHLLHLPTWIIQRFWLSLLLFVGFFGIVRMLEALRIGDRRSTVVAGLAYMLAPPVVILGFVTDFIQPFSLLPWIMLPLIKGSRSGSPRIAAAKSGVALLFVGGINAVLPIAILPVPLIWLATRTKGARRRSLTLWWLLGSSLACIWWFVPLLYENRYGFSIVGYTEKAFATTGSASLFEILRGTSSWLAHFKLGYITNQAGSQSTTSIPMILGVTALVCIGIFGISSPKIKEKLWLSLTLLSGIVFIGIGYGGALGSPFAQSIQSLLDGPFAPFRNVSKFQPMISLVIAVGIAHGLHEILCVLDRFRLKAQTWRSSIIPRLLICAVLLFCGVALVASSKPLVKQNFYPNGSFKQVPSYWTQTSTWLDEHSGRTTSLVVPGSSFGTYTWGNPLDEPLQWLANSNWATRNVVPNSSSGAIQVENLVNQILDSKLPNTYLAQILQQSGVKYLVVRNDLNPVIPFYINPAQIDSVLTQAKGMQLVKSFGKVNAFQNRIDIYGVSSPVEAVVSRSTTNSIGVRGDPSSMQDLFQMGLSPDNLVLFRTNIPTPVNIITDSLRREAANLGSPLNDHSYVLLPHEKVAGSNSNPTPWDPKFNPKSLTNAGYFGAASITASSAGSLNLSNAPSQQPYAAFDNNPNTAWVADSSNNSLDQWIQISFTKPHLLSKINLQLFQTTSNPQVKQIEVSTEAGTILDSVVPDESLQSISVKPGLTSWLKIRFSKVEPPSNSNLFHPGAGIITISIPGVHVTRALVVPKAQLSNVGPAHPAFLFDSGFSLLGSDVIPSNDEEPNMTRYFEVTQPTHFKMSGFAVATLNKELLNIADLSGKDLHSDTPFSIPCGKGPRLVLNGVVMQTSINGTYGDLLRSTPLSASACSPDQSIELPSGGNLLRVENQTFLKLYLVSLTPVEASPLGHVEPSTNRTVSIQQWNPGSRKIVIGPGSDSYLIIRQNFNAGWVATLNGNVLTPAEAYGWQQAYELPASSGGIVSLVYAPNKGYQTGLFIGLLLVVLLLFLAVFPRRRKEGKQPSISESSGFPLFALSAAGALLLFLVAGPIALMLPLVALFGSKIRRFFPMLAASLYLLAGIMVAFSVPFIMPDRGFSAWVQGLTAISIIIVISGSFLDVGLSKRFRLNRRREPEI